MTIKMRSFHWDEDFELIRSFLIDTYNQTQSLHNWIPNMFENRKFGPCGSLYQDKDDELVRIWEERDEDSPLSARIVAFTVAKSSGASWIQIHPNYRHLERELLEWLELQARELGDSDLRFYVMEDDGIRQELLKESGYDNLGLESNYLIRPLDIPIPEYQLPEGFTIRHVDILEEIDQYRDVQSSVFSHCGVMTEKHAEIYRSASFYVAELDLVAVAPDGKFAAFCTVRLDPVSRIAEFEPVGTHPEYRRLGLGKALLLEGLRRLKEFNPSLVCIQGAAPTEAANRLYDSIGFSEKTAVDKWYKKF